VGCWHLGQVVEAVTGAYVKHIQTAVYKIVGPPRSPLALPDKDGE